MKPDNEREQARDAAIMEIVNGVGMQISTHEMHKAIYVAGYTAAQPAWVPVEGRLPTESGMYLTVLVGGGKWLVDAVRFDGVRFCVPHHKLIQAWMPIPPYIPTNGGTNDDPR